MSNRVIAVTLLFAFSAIAQKPAPRGSGGGSGNGASNVSNTFSSSATSVVLTHNLGSTNIDSTMVSCDTGTTTRTPLTITSLTSITTTQVTVNFSAAPAAGRCRLNASGVAGPTGPAGANGTNGTNGTNGADGATGPQGPAGEVTSDAGTYANGQFVVSSGTSGDAIKPLTGTGVVKMTSGVPSVVSGTSSDCVKVDGSSGTCGGGGGAAASPYSVTLTGTGTPISVPYTTHLNQGDVTVVCKDASGDFMLNPYRKTAASSNFDLSISNNVAGTCSVASLGSGVGSVTSVGFTGGLISVATASSTPAFTVAGTSGGIPYFSSSSTWASSGALTASALLLGGGAGSAPTAMGSLGTTTTVLHGNAAGAPTFGAISLTADVSGILPVANGGTNNAFFTVSGPASSAKTYTFPNANATVLTSNAAVTVAQGGTGVATLTGPIKGNGTSAFSAAAAADIYGLWSGTCSSSTFLRGDGSCQTPSGTGTVTVVSSGSLTSTALVTGGGTTTLQTPSATSTLDSSGNMSLAGSISAGVGGSTAGYLELTQGTTASAGTTSIKLQAPTSVTSYVRTLPDTAGTGFYLGTNSAGVVTDTQVAASGTGSVCLTTSCVMTTPNIGVAAATSVNKVAITAPATSATLTIANGKTLTVSNTVTMSGTDSSTIAFGAGGTVAYTIASGTAALGTSAIASGACATVVTATATGGATTDTLTFTPNADITAVTGYAPVTTGGLAIYPYVTTNTANFKVCNPTASSITPGAVSLNWRITR